MASVLALLAHPVWALAWELVAAHRWMERMAVTTVPRRTMGAYIVGVRLVVTETWLRAMTTSASVNGWACSFV